MYLDRVLSALDIEDRCRVEIAGKVLGIQRCRQDNEL